MDKINTLLRTLNSVKYNMAFLLKTISCLVILIIVVFFLVMANVSSDVDYLRQQYNAGKSQKDKLIIKYNDKQFQDGDVLQKADTQNTPTVKHTIDTDPQNPYFTLVILNFSIFMTNDV
jgi:hypothetical protein